MVVWSQNRSKAPGQRPSRTHAGSTDPRGRGRHARPLSNTQNWSQGSPWATVPTAAGPAGDRAGGRGRPAASPCGTACFPARFVRWLRDGAAGRARPPLPGAGTDLPPLPALPAPGGAFGGSARARQSRARLWRQPGAGSLVQLPSTFRACAAPPPSVPSSHSAPWLSGKRQEREPIASLQSPRRSRFHMS